MLLPIALHFAVADAGRRSALARWLPAGLIALALSLSISRSAIICTAIALPVLLTAWPRHLRRRVYLAAPALIACLTVAMPGFYGTVLGLFTGIGNDSSAQSRTGSYGLAWSFVARAPVFGRGVGTFLPPYRILDNQYLGSLIELGFVGLACLLLLFGVGVHTSWQLRKLPGAGERMPVGGVAGAAGGGARADSSMLSSALAAATLGGVVSFAFFDAWGFPMIPSILFLLLGCAGALRRLVLEGDPSVKGTAAVPGHRTGGLAEKPVAEGPVAVGEGQPR
jgi:O-antigen ligase